LTTTPRIQKITVVPAVDDFLKTVLRSGLLNREQLQSALRHVPRELRDDAQGLADQLVKQGKLVRFQAQKLLQGAALGLMLGPYQLRTPIGKGGMGTVFLAQDTRSGERVAVKVLPPKKAREEERYLARFRREMELSQKVRHPHIALTYDVGVFRGVYYIALEFIPGLSLHRLVNKEGPLTVARAARLFSEICAGLEHAHGVGLIHRDLKPSNVMVTPNYHAKVLDLGLALMEGEVAEDAEVIGGQGYVVGSMDYIAPEQTEDAAGVDARADIYSMGCSLYYVLSGRPPFPGGTNREKMKRHRREEAEPLERLNAAVPEAFARVVRKMMAKDRAQRYPSAFAAREELLSWAVAEPSLPLDLATDKSYQDAIAKLEAADFTPEVGELILLKTDTPPEQPGKAPTPPAQQGRHLDYWWIVLGLLGFWLIVVIILGVVAIFL
jgi:eukaryotic-like serine/threonine-protein kinase